MSWYKLSSCETVRPLVLLARRLKGRQCCVTYSPIPGNATITLTVLPGWEAAARSKHSGAGRREVMRFSGVTEIRTTARDTISMGDFAKLEWSCDGERNTWRIILKDFADRNEVVEFSSSQCELNQSAGKGKGKRGRP
jgi:hypothetical protein